MKGLIETVSPLVPDQGTKLMTNKKVYNFAANEHGHFVAECLNEVDYAAILSIGAGYRTYNPAVDYPELKLKAPAEQSKIPLTRNVRIKPKKKNRPSRKPTQMVAGKKATAPAGLAVDPAAG